MRRTLSAERRCALFSIPTVLLLLSTCMSCSDSEDAPAERPVRGSFGPVDQPIPPEGFLEHLPPEERQAELSRLAEGTRMEDLPPDERAEVAAANENDRRRAPIRQALAHFARAQARRAQTSLVAPVNQTPSEEQR